MLGRQGGVACWAVDVQVSVAWVDDDDCVAWVLLLVFSSLWHAFGTGLGHTEPHTGQRPYTMTGADDRGR